MNGAHPQALKHGSLGRAAWRRARTCCGKNPDPGALCNKSTTSQAAEKLQDQVLCNKASTSQTPEKTQIARRFVTRARLESGRKMSQTRNRALAPADLRSRISLHLLPVKPAPFIAQACPTTRQSSLLSRDPSRSSQAIAARTLPPSTCA